MEPELLFLRELTPLTVFRLFSNFSCIESFKVEPGPCESASMEILKAPSPFFWRIVLDIFLLLALGMLVANLVEVPASSSSWFFSLALTLISDSLVPVFSLALPPS